MLDQASSLFYLMTIASMLAISETADMLGDAFKVCSRSDPALDKCIVDSINSARGQLAKGLPELGVPPLKRFKGDELRVEEGPRDVHLRLVLRNYTWHDLGDFEVIRARVDLEKPYIELETYWDSTSTSAFYRFEGSILSLRIQGDGPCDITAQGVNATHRIDLEEVERDGAVYWRVKNYLWVVDAQNYSSDFRNLFQGNRRLGQYANAFINTNWRAMLMVYRDTIAKGFGKVFQRFADAVLERVALSNLLMP